MASKHFTVEIKPTIQASLLAAAAFGADELLFDWESFQVPRGANKLVNASIIHRAGTGGAVVVKDIDLIFAKTVNNEGPRPLGAVNGTVSAAPVVANHCLGIAHVDASGDYGGKGFDYFAVGTTGSGGGASLIPNMVLEGEVNSGDNVGYDTLWVGGITAESGHDFRTTVLARGGEAAGVTVVETDKGSDDDPDAELIFAPGDVIHGKTDAVMGTIASIGGFGSNKQDITFEAATPEILDNNEELININPIRVILSFER